MLYYVQVDSIERLPDVHGREEILKVHTKDTLLGAGIRLRGIYIYRPFFSFFCLELFFYKGEKERDKNPKPYSKYVGFLNPNTKVFRAIFLPFFFPSFRGDTKARCSL